MEVSTMLCFLFSSILFIVLFRIFIKQFVSKRQHLPLPPGSMGYPYIGETFQLYSQDPNVFFASKIKRYGSMFKSHILGCPCVMISSPEAAKFVLNKAQLFKPTFPASKERMLGKQAIFFHQGEYHANLRRLVLRTFMPEAIKNIVPDIESIAEDSLKSMEGRLITTFLEMKTFTFNVALLSIFGKDEIHYRERLKQCYYTLEKGYNSMPINLPGTLFHKAMKARKELAQILAEIISSRREKKQDFKDLLGSFMDEKSGLSDEQIADNVIGVIFAARDTTASVLTWIVKYLGENINVLESVIEEQESILRNKEENGEEKGLKWEDTKKMVITSRVIQETLRVASILSFTFREAVEDVEYQGYLIPKGWKVLPLFRNIHHSPNNFKDPEKFDPSRFETATKPNTFMPFGSGVHACPGNELAKLEILLKTNSTSKVSTTITITNNNSFIRSSMEFFQRAKAVRLRSHHEKYLHAEEDEESINQERNGSSNNAKWTVEHIPEYDNIIRLKSCYGKYLTASNQPLLLGVTGRKVVQTLPRRLDSSVEWEPVRDGAQVKLKTRYGNFLRANGGLPPWRNSVTHDIPHRSATQDWILWDVDVLEIHVGNPPPPPIPHSDSLDFGSSALSFKSNRFDRQESTDSVGSPPKMEGRTIYYHVAEENGDVDDENVQGYSLVFNGNDVEQLTRKFVEETGLDGVIVCSRSPLNGKLYPLRLHLPPNNVTMQVVLVLASSKVAKEFEEQGLL